MGIKDKVEQLKLATKIIDFNMNIRDTETEVKEKKKIMVKGQLSESTAYIVELEENLMRALGTKVNLSTGNKKGKIEIEYYGDEDLERIYDLLIG